MSEPAGSVATNGFYDSPLDSSAIPKLIEGKTSQGSATLVFHSGGTALAQPISQIIPR